VGGSDQLHNIEAGYSLIRNERNDLVYGLFLPLLTDKDGNKFGKSANNAFSLNPNINSPFEFYQVCILWCIKQIINSFFLFYYFTI